jgi:RNA 2',3'-cyclic 3'-phosphodiesterase
VTLRAFVSADLGGAPGLDRFLQELRAAGEGLKIVSPAQLHVTLKFLGDIEDGIVPAVLDIVQAACSGIGPIRLRIRSAGSFPSLARMKVIWVGLEGAEPLGTIAGRLDARLERLGILRESRPWAPHVTVARVRAPRGLDRVRGVIESHREEVFAEVAVSEIGLKQSVLTPSGPIYSDIGRVALRANGP